MAGRGGKRSTSWVKGQSGNPKGFPKLPPEAQDALNLARQYTPDAINALRDIAMDKAAAPAARVTAAEAILNRVYGKPKEFNETTVKHERRSESEVLSELVALGLVAGGVADKGVEDAKGEPSVH
jgi:hypothetical protein